MPTNAETKIQSSILKALNKIPGIKLYRNNVGKVDLGGGRLMQVGLCNGSSDLIGYQSVTITPDMVGQKAALFISLEIKTATGRLTDHQKLWLEKVDSAGGRAGVARNLDDALKALGIKA